MTQETTESCLSDLQLDSLMVGDLAPPATRKAERHLVSCTRCSARRRELARVAEDLFARRPTLGWTRPVSPSPGRPSWIARWKARHAPALVAAAVGLAGVAVLTLSSLGPPSGGQRTKGAAFVFEAYSLTPKGDVALVLDGERLSPGDRLRFRITSAQPGYVAVVSVDPTGEASSYLPTRSSLAPLPAGRPIELDGSAELDERLGPERLIAVVCPHPIETTAVLRAVPDHLDDLAGCATAGLSFEKVQRSR